MGSVNLVVIVESARGLITHDGGTTNDFHVASIVAVGAALGMYNRSSMCMPAVTLLYSKTNSDDVLWTPQVSNSYYSCTATPIGINRVKSLFYGKTIVMTYLSMVSVRFACDYQSQDDWSE